MNIYPVLSDQEELIGKQLVNIAFAIHKALGPGLLESVYEKCFCHELRRKSIPFARQKMVEIVYDDMIIDDGLRVDILVNDSIIIELKAQENYHPVWEAQLLSYLKLTGNRLGFIFNFHVPLMKDGIKRMIL